MSSITISKLNPAGSELFSDSESYLTQLSEQELEMKGGIWPIVLASSEPCGMAIAFGAAAIFG